MPRRDGVAGAIETGAGESTASLARNPDRAAAMGDAGRRLALTPYRWEDAARRWEAVFARVTA